MEIFIDLVLIILKAALALGMLLHLAAMVIWVERKGSALIQDRMGANRASILGLDLAGIFNTLVADPVKALLKEDFLPRGVSQFMHSMGPFMAVFPVLISFAVIPFGPPIHLSGFEFTLPFFSPIKLAPREISLQVADLNVGVLYIFAMGSLAVYGVMLAGWVSRNKFSLLGGLRSSAQMISYEVTLGISIVGLIAVYGTLDLNRIIAAQNGTIYSFLPAWGIFRMFPFNMIAFVIFFTSMMAETKRAPFDLPESESEIVAGYLTEYSGMKFLLFWLGEFSEIVVASSIFVILFFGGWHLPYFDIQSIPANSPLIFWAIASAFGLLALITPRMIFRGLFLLFSGVLALYAQNIGDILGMLNFQWAPVLALVIFGAKVSFFCVLQVIIRWTLPRFRYDQLMSLCWKGMLPISILNLVCTVFFLILNK